MEPDQIDGSKPVIEDAELERIHRSQPADGLLMAQASVSLLGDPGTEVEIRRGMVILAADNQVTGKVAGVLVSRAGRQALYLLISHLPEAAGYQALPLGWIARVDGARVWLTVELAQVVGLPGWHAA